MLNNVRIGVTRPSIDLCSANIVRQTLADDQATWVKETQDKVFSILQETPPDGDIFAKTIKVLGATFVCMMPSCNAFKIII